eukprot:5712559-Pleurochrysis_carterae.AAC.1
MRPLRPYDRFLLHPQCPSLLALGPLLGLCFGAGEGFGVGSARVDGGNLPPLPVRAYTMALSVRTLFIGFSSAQA